MSKARREKNKRGPVSSAVLGWSDTLWAPAVQVGKEVRCAGVIEGSDDPATQSGDQSVVAQRDGYDGGAAAVRDAARLRLPDGG